MNFETAGISQKHGRKTNEDFFDYVLTATGGCWVLADGLGGHSGGEKASRLAVTEVIDSFWKLPEFSPRALSHYFSAAQEALLKVQKEEPCFAEMRTTCVILVAHKEHALWGHVGDSRLYSFNNGGVVQQTLDHSVPQALVAAGELKPEDIRYHEDRNRLLRALGQEADLRPTITMEKKPIGAGDAFLLCTDGFWEYVHEPEMEMARTKSHSPEEWLNKMEDSLLNRANKEMDKHHDNYTAIAIMMRQ